jgi:hypothetical protein
MVLTELAIVLVVETDSIGCFTRLPVASNPSVLAIVPAAGVRVAAIPFTVLVSALDVAASVLLLMMGTVAPDTPFTVVSNVLAELVLSTEFTAGAVAATPFTVLVSVLTELDIVWVVATDPGDCVTSLPVASKPRLLAMVPEAGVNVAATPFTVLVRAFDDASNVLAVVTDEGICFTRLPVASNPSVLVIVPAAGVSVAAIPFTVLVSALDVAANVLLLMMGTVAPDTPLTVVSNVLAELVLSTEFTAGAVADTPFTVLVSVLTELDIVWVVATDPGDCVTSLPVASKPRLLAMVPEAGVNVAATPFTVLVRAFDDASNVLAVVTDEGTCFTRLPVASNPSVLVIVPAAGVSVVVIPFTVLVSALDVAANVLLLMMGTVAPDTPLTVVSNVLSELALLTELIAADGVAFIQLVPLYCNKLPETGLVIDNGIPFSLSTEVAPRFPDTSPANEATSVALVTFTH